MTLKFTRIWAFFLLLCATAPFVSSTRAQPATAPAAQEQDLLATRDLVREVQFMLLRLGYDPGPLDGVPRQLTNAAVQRFEQANGLPRVELQPGGKVPAEFLARLRAEAGRAMFGAASKPETGPRGSPSPGVEQSPTTLPNAAVAPAPPKLPPPDRFASCAYNPEDFQIGANRYSPDTFLNEGFDGSTTRAVANLKDRLEEGRQIADKIGISALKEVQRQARVLQYFECRLKIEQAAAGKG
jgi:peptidoglycan hydrolase-like protein with peptidoglycan-binding domain